MKRIVTTVENITYEGECPECGKKQTGPFTKLIDTECIECSESKEYGRNEDILSNARIIGIKYYKNLMSIDGIILSSGGNKYLLEYNDSGKLIYSKCEKRNNDPYYKFVMFRIGD